ncbi:hypothetical protein [Corynebacterium spheniscorum]|uniref:hypothetical protein n=1 Tax=Corynebacterium spheniscorum TaxID=185761 RepID=UPI001160D9FE|nr:hypothetical protein [Corynebacterium spheniscorum]KAA8723913.1 hypothetical protein F4V56_01100 [Corynebacterium spheniscorum]
MTPSEAHASASSGTEVRDKSLPAEAEIGVIVVVSLTVVVTSAGDTSELRGVDALVRGCSVSAAPVRCSVEVLPTSAVASGGTESG